MKALDVSPPLATISSSPAARCRPPFSARPTRASCISFAAASGRDNDLGGQALRPQHETQTPRPTTARPSSSHRRLTLGSSTQWQFLTKTPAEGDQPRSTMRPSSSRASRLRTRPETTRVDGAAASSSVPTTPPAPKRPATCRGPRTQSAADPSRKSTPAKPNLVLVDPRVIQEAARHETEQELYASPLVGKSVEIQQPDLLALKPFRDSCVVNAVSLSEFHRGKAFLARAKGNQLGAITHLEKLLELVPHDQVALFQLAVAFEKTGRLEDAQRTYNCVLPLDSKNSFLHYNIGNLLMKMDRVEDAIAAYTTAIHFGGSGKCQNLAFYRQRGAAYRKNGDFEKAAQDYARVHAVHHRRRSLTVDPSKLVAAPSTLKGVPVVTHTDEWIDDEYSADQIYSANHFAAHCTPTGQATTSVELLNHRQAMAIALKPAHARTEQELLVLGDELAHRFPCCAALDPEARQELSKRVVAGVSLPRGAMLVHEGTSRGGYMFFISCGRVSVYKRFAPRVVASFNDNQEAERATESTRADPDAVVSWELLRATVHDDPEHCSDDKDEVFHSVAKRFPVVDLESWSSGGGSGRQQQVLLTHLTSGDVCGRQGRFSQQERLYSAVVNEQCDFFAVSWADFQDVERLHRLARSTQLVRFFGTIPLFHGLPNEELIQLSQRAKNWKVVGERVVCTEGQQVNGLIVVREGQLCQLFPSELSRPPNLSVTFGLSGSISMNDRDAEHGGLHFFTQLEHSDDPLLFVHDSALMHGFLSREFLPQALARLSDQQREMDVVADSFSPTSREDDCASVSAGRSSTGLRRGATNLARGAFFNASSSWIPPRKSRRQELLSTGSGGVSCAKTALVTTESCELVFFTASDLTLGLSMKSRAQLQQNMQQINSRRTQASEASASVVPSAGLSSLRRLVFLKPPSGDDMVHKYRHEMDWQIYKQELVKSIVTGAREKRSRSLTPRDVAPVNNRLPSAPFAWKR